MEALGSTVVVFACVFAVVERNNITGGLVGLAISYALQITDKMAFFVRNLSDLENNTIAVERITEYSNTTSEVKDVIQLMQLQEIKTLFAQVWSH